MKTNYYNSISKGYEELYGEEQLKKVELIKEHLKLNGNELLLDVGCGTGLTTKYWDCRKVGIDPAIKLLKGAQGALFVNAEAEHIPFKDNSFDVVVSITSIQNFQDIEKGLSEIKRVAKNKAVLSFLKKSEKRELIAGLIKKMFNINKIIEEDKDLIFFVGI